MTPSSRAAASGRITFDRENIVSVDVASIKEHMSVIAADGEAIGKVDHVQDGRIKLTKNDSPDGQHHFVPMHWIERVDTHVHLNKTLVDIRAATGGGSVSPTDAVPEAGKRDAVPEV